MRTYDIKDNEISFVKPLKNCMINAETHFLEDVNERGLNLNDEINVEVISDKGIEFTFKSNKFFPLVDGYVNEFDVDLKDFTLTSDYNVEEIDTYIVENIIEEQYFEASFEDIINRNYANCISSELIHRFLIEADIRDEKVIGIMTHGINILAERIFEELYEFITVGYYKEVMQYL